jgi:hypothetical protein
MPKDNNCSTTPQLKIGDKVFIKIYMTNKIGYGNITEIHKPSKDGYTYVSFCCQISNRFELGNVDDIILKPKKSHWNLLNKSYRQKK